jgi:hypothetical protein
MSSCLASGMSTRRVVIVARERMHKKVGYDLFTFATRGPGLSCIWFQRLRNEAMKHCPFDYIPSLQLRYSRTPSLSPCDLRERLLQIFCGRME